MKIAKFLPLFILAVIPVILSACASGPPLVQAINSGKTAEFNQLLADGADVNAATKEGVTPLHVASARWDEEVVEKLLQKGADVNAAIKTTFTYKGETIFEGGTPLMWALAKQQAKIAGILIRNGADVNAKTATGSTAIMIAAGQDDETIVQTLIEKGADLNAATTTAFDYQGETIQKGSTALMGAVAKKQPENARILIENGADVNASTEYGVTPLTIAGSVGDHLSMKAMLDKGADPNAKTTKDFVHKEMPIFSGGSALMAAADGGSAECVRFLLEAGCDINATNKVGASALMAAAAKGHLDAVKLLVAQGADVNCKTTEKFTMGKNPVPKGSSVLSGAAYKGHTDVVRYLVEHGADVNTREDEFGIDPLYLAAMMGHVEITKLLVGSGADVFYENKRGTAYSMAYHNNYRDIVKYIKDAREAVQAKQESEGKKEK